MHIVCILLAIKQEINGETWLTECSGSYCETQVDKGPDKEWTKQTINMYQKIFLKTVGLNHLYHKFIDS